MKLEELLGEELYAQVKAKLDAANEKIENKNSILMQKAKELSGID